LEIQAYWSHLHKQWFFTLFGGIAADSLMLLFTQYKYMYKQCKCTCQDVCVQQSHAANPCSHNMKWTLEDLLPCYCKQ